MNKRVVLFFLISFVLIPGCKAVSASSQQATATAFANAHMVKAMEAAEAGAQALCTLDFGAGPDAYAEDVCAVSTTTACAIIQEEVANTWEDMRNANNSDQLACALSSSRLLEEGQQYGMHVQYWRVYLKGVQGFSEDQSDLEYWLQVAEENGAWKFNRLLSSAETALYLSIGEMEG